MINMDSLFVCPRCGNAATASIGYLNGKPYCRACVSFNGEEADADYVSFGEPTLDIDYQLSPEQRHLASDLVEAYHEGKDVLIHAVTGSGKTEIVFALIQVVINEGRKIGFAIPRRDVVTELGFRFHRAFPHLVVTSVYGGHHQTLTGDLIVLTTHQLFRYRDYFDVLIIDEYDAFPFQGNRLLQHFARQSLKGMLVALTATPTADMLETFSKEKHAILRLWTRYHRHPLPVPCTIRRLPLLKMDWLISRINQYRKLEQPLIVFVPTIESGRRLFALLRWFCPNGAFVHSQTPERQSLITAFRKKKYAYLVSTSILERGITLPRLQVIVYDAHHVLYDEGTLIQMAGRVGRRKNAPEGDVSFLALRVTRAMKGAIRHIEHANSHL